MKQDVQVEVIERLLRLADGHEPDMAEATSAPLSHYTSPEHFAREREVLFGKFPLIVGFSSQVAAPGDYFTHDLTGTPILVTRDQEGRLNAFVNACRHRGARVATEPCGSGQSHFSCPYHGWNYDADGRLRGVPFPAGFPGLDKDRYGLVRLAAAERYGLVFVLFTPGETFDVDEFLGPLLRELGTFGLDDYVLAEARTHRREMNWKLQVDAALETYHFGYLHSRTSGGYYNNVALYDWSEPHARVVVPKRTIGKLRGTEPAGWRVLDYGSILYSVFPNAAVFLAADNVHVICTYPDTIGTSVIYGGMLVRKGPVNEQVRKFYHDHYWKVQGEDMMIAESVQAGISTGVISELLFGRHEFLTGRFHAAIDDALAGRLRACGAVLA